MIVQLRKTFGVLNSISHITKFWPAGTADDRVAAQSDTRSPPGGDLNGRFSKAPGSALSVKPCGLKSKIVQGPLQFRRPRPIQADQALLARSSPVSEPSTTSTPRKECTSNVLIELSFTSADATSLSTMSELRIVFAA